MNKKTLIEFLKLKGFIQARESNDHCAIYIGFYEPGVDQLETFWLYEDCVSMEYRGHNIGDLDYASIKIIENELWINLEG